MRAPATLAAALSLLSTASAIINSISAPSEVAPGSTVRLEINAVDYIQSVQDVAIAFGIQPAAHAAPDSLGTLLSSRFLGPDESNIVGTIYHYVEIPAATPEGPTVLTGALFSLFGALYSPTVQDFAVNVTVANTTSSTYVSSS